MRLYGKTKEVKSRGKPRSRQGRRNIVTPCAEQTVPPAVTLLVAISTVYLLYMKLLECEWQH